MTKYSIIALRIFVVALDVSLFYLFFWLLDKSCDLQIAYEWWASPTFILSALLIFIVGFFITIIAFSGNSEELCKK